MLQICFTLFYLADNLAAVPEGLVIISVVVLPRSQLAMNAFLCFTRDCVI